MAIIKAVVCHSCDAIEALPDPGNPYRLPKGWGRYEYKDQAHECPDCGGGDYVADDVYYQVTCTACGLLDETDMNDEVQELRRTHAASTESPTDHIVRVREIPYE